MFCVPIAAKYEIKPGMRGKMQGLRNDPSPARNDTNNDVIPKPVIAVPSEVTARPSFPSISAMNAKFDILLNSPTNINIPITIRSAPKKYENQFSFVPTLSIHLCAASANTPTIKNGIPIPSVYARRRKNALAGEVEARTRIAPSAAPTQGLHPTAKAAPNTKEVTYFELNFFVTLTL